MESVNGFIKDRKPVEKYSVDGVFIQEYNSVNSAASDNEISAASITNCIKKRQKTAAGFTWKFKRK